MKYLYSLQVYDNTYISNRELLLNLFHHIAHRTLNGKDKTKDT
jgi:hypothetical protein